MENEKLVDIKQMEAAWQWAKACAIMQGRMRDFLRDSGRN